MSDYSQWKLGFLFSYGAIILQYVIHVNNMMLCIAFKDVRLWMSLAFAEAYWDHSEKIESALDYSLQVLTNGIWIAAPRNARLVRFAGKQACASSANSPWAANGIHQTLFANWILGLLIKLILLIIVNKQSTVHRSTAYPTESGRFGDAHFRCWDDT